LADEASNCMHCDCRALDNCRLRDLCNEYKIKNPVRLRNGNPVEKRISSTSGLIFENAKCIKCGLCVRVSTDATNESSLCFTGRGFMTLIAEPLTSDFDSLDLKNIKKAVDICPTGALAIED
ncbi:MAG: ferredoxin, partial [Eudoraea sp.]|nr:ferredoxin [Eudoraea sp.]